MKKSHFMEKYPVYTLEVSKEECQFETVPQIIAYLKGKVDAHKIAEFIAVFDHYGHTKRLGGEIHPEIVDVQNLIFCFGSAIPSTKIVAVRPRSIGVCELKDKFIIEFLEAPKEEMHSTMEEWAKSVVRPS